MIFTVPAFTRPLASGEQLVDLLDPPMTVPPERRDDAHGELPCVVQLSVRREQVRFDPCVLPPGDPERGEVLLRPPQVHLPLVGARRWHELAQYRVRGPLLEAARRRPVGIAHEVAVERIRRVGVPPGELERPRVHPPGVHVGVQQEHRPIGHDGVEVRGERAGVAEHRAVPAAAQDPRQVGVRLGEGPDPLEVRVAVDEVVEVHVQEVAGAERRVDVRVLEPREDHAPGEVEVLAAGPDRLADVGLGADRHDAVAADRHGLDPPPGGVNREDVGAGDDEVGWLGHARTLPAGGRAGQRGTVASK